MAKSYTKGSIYGKKPMRSAVTHSNTGLRYLTVVDRVDEGLAEIAKGMSMVREYSMYIDVVVTNVVPDS